MDNRIKIDIGCGASKTVGYIGVDRFPLEGVDIVADIEKGIPFENNSVDVIFASHSLEHMEDIDFVLTEIFRISHHGTILHILAPYYNTSTNLGNFFHKQVFNEDTFRFFSLDSETIINSEEYYNPHAVTWGLGNSDHSNSIVNMTILDMEFFYFPAYQELSTSEKIHARKALNNVCDQVLYSLVINKSGAMLSREECEGYKTIAKELEPSKIDLVRSRYVGDGFKKSILTDIEEKVEHKIDINNKQIIDEIKPFKNEIINNRKEIEKILKNTEDMASKIISLKNELINNKRDIEQNSKIIEDMASQIISLKKGLDIYNFENKNKINSVTAFLVDIIKAVEQIRKKTWIFNWNRKKHDIYEELAINNRRFTDAIVIENGIYTKEHIVGFSELLPFSGYVEYQIIAKKSELNFFVIASYESSLFVEVVSKGKIIKQDVIKIKNQNQININLDDKPQEISIRFKCMDNTSLIRVLELKKIGLTFRNNKELAYY